MSDKPGPGGNPRQGPLNANAWARVVDNTNRIEERETFGRPIPGSFIGPVDPAKIRLYNNTGSTRRRGDCLQVNYNNGSKTGAEADNRFRIIDALANDPRREFAILMEPTAYGELGEAAVSGYVWAYVYINDLNHRYAEPDSGGYTLTTSSVSNGPVYVVYRPTASTGEQLCIVHINHGYRDGRIGYANLITCAAGPAFVKSSSKYDIYQAETDFAGGVSWSLIGQDYLHNATSLEYLNITVRVIQQAGKWVIINGVPYVWTYSGTYSAGIIPLTNTTWPTPVALTYRYTFKTTVEWNRGGSGSHFTSTATLLDGVGASIDSSTVDFPITTAAVTTKKFTHRMSGVAAFGAGFASATITADATSIACTGTKLTIEPVFNLWG